MKVCDENTIVVASWALPSTARMSPSRRSARRSTILAETGIDIPVHVDGASGAFIAPFLDRDLQ